VAVVLWGIKGLPAIFRTSDPDHLAITGDLKPMPADHRLWYVVAVNQGVDVNMPTLVPGPGELYPIDTATPGSLEQLPMPQPSKVLPDLIHR